MCVFLISPVPIAEPLTSELIDTPVFYNLAPRPIKYRVSVPIPTLECSRRILLIFSYIDNFLYEKIQFYEKNIFHFKIAIYFCDSFMIFQSVVICGNITLDG